MTGGASAVLSIVGAVIALAVLAGIAGLGGFWISIAVRNFDFVKRGALEGKKPWACTACMSGWSTLIWLFAICGAVGFTGDIPKVAGIVVLGAWLPAAGCALLFRTWYDARQPPSGDLPMPSGD